MLVIPKLSIIQQIKGRVLNALVRRCAAEGGVAFTAVKPGHWIARPVELGEFDLVGGVRRLVTISVRVYSSTPREVRRAAVATMLGDGVILTCASHSSHRGRQKCPVAVGRGAVTCAQALLLQMQHDNARPCCCCLMSCKSPEIDRTNSSKRLRILLRSSPPMAESFPDLKAVGGMAPKSEPFDTRLSRASGRIAWETKIRGRRLYLYETDGRGPGPRRCEGAVLAPR
jgi:hypothetical protein